MIASYLESDREYLIPPPPPAFRDNFINRIARRSQKVIFHPIFARKKHNTQVPIGMRRLILIASGE